MGQFEMAISMGMMLALASIMNSFALMRINANMVVHREVLLAMQNRLQVVELEMKSLKSKILASSSNEASQAR